MKRFSLVLVSLVLSACGGSLKDGYYVYDASVNPSKNSESTSNSSASYTSPSYSSYTYTSYPFVIVKADKNKTTVYTAEYDLLMGSSVNGSASFATTVVAKGSDNTVRLGYLTQKGENLRVRSLVGPTMEYKSEKDVEKAKVSDDSLLKPISKDEAMKQHRNRAYSMKGRSSYTAEQEAACQGAFGMSCKELYK